MKKMLVLISAILSALAVAELATAGIIRYPRYGIESKMLGIRGMDKAVNIFKPYSKYWTVEGGNQVYRRNNLGLPGIDVRVEQGSKFVFVLGSSFIEAYQVPPEKIAVSIFQKKLDKQFPDYQVLNLGKSGHDPYDLYWRGKYFSQKLSPALVLLVIDEMTIKWLKRHHFPLNFNPDFKKPRVINSYLFKLAIAIRNHSAFMNLMSEFVKKRSPLDEDETFSEAENFGDSNKSDSGLAECLAGFNCKYRNKFCVISSSDLLISHPDLKECCQKNGIPLLFGEFHLPKYRINQKGHLNADGNIFLGGLLYEIFVQFEKKKKFAIFPIFPKIFRFISVSIPLPRFSGNDDSYNETKQPLLLCRVLKGFFHEKNTSNRS